MRTSLGVIHRLLGIALLAGQLLLGAETAEAQTPPKHIKIGAINILTFSPVYVAKELGYFKDEGLDVDIFETTSGSALNAALLGGSVAATASGYSQPLVMSDQGKKLKGIVGMEMASPYVFLVNPKLNIPADDPQALANALKGKRFGVVSIGSSGHMTAEGLLARYGVSNKDVTFVAVGAGSSALAALKSGAVDAVNPTEPDVTQILDSGVGVIALDLRKTAAEKVYSTLPSSTIQATAEWIDANPDAAAAIVRAITRANDTLRRDPKTSLDVLSKLYPNLSRENIEKVYASSKDNFKSAIEEEQFVNAQKVYLQAGLVKKPVSYESVVATQFQPLWSQ